MGQKPEALDQPGREQEIIQEQEKKALLRMRASEYSWFLAKEESLEGPLKIEELLTRCRDGSLTEFDFCWRHGFQEWRPLSSVEEIAIQLPKPASSARRESLKTPAYPKVDAPYRKDLEITLKRKFPNIKQSRLRSVKVRLSKVRRRELAVGELFIVFVLALFLALQTFHRGLDLVEQKVETFVHVKSMGKHIVLGRAGPKHSEAYLLTPLLAAPGFPGKKGVALSLEGNFHRKHAALKQVGGMRIRSDSSTLGNFRWSDIDPVYSKRVQVNGVFVPVKGRPEVWMESGQNKARLSPLARETFFDCFHNRLACL